MIESEKLNAINFQKTTMILFIVVVFLFVASIPNRRLHGDDAWIGEYAYFLQQEGKIKSELLRGFLNYEEGIHFTAHKLLYVLGAVSISIFGWSFYALNSIATLSLLILFFMIRRYLKRYLSMNSAFFFLFGTLFLINFHAFQFSFSFRPELPSLCLGFASFMLLRQFKDARKIPVLLGAALLAALSALVHLNGLAYLVAGFALLIYRKEYANALLFGIVSNLLFCLYFVDLMINGQLHLFFEQMSGYNEMMGYEVGLKFYLQKLTYLYSKFFHSLKEISFTLLIIAVVSKLQKSKFKSELSEIILYVVILTLSLVLLTHENTAKYNLHFIPYLLLIILILFRQLLERRNLKRILIASVVFAVYFFTQLGYDIRLISERNDIAQKNSHVTSLISRYSETPINELKILAHPEFIFNEIENYERIQSMMYYDFILKKFRKKRVESLEFFELARNFDTDFIYLNKKYLPYAEARESIDFYQLVHQDEDGMLLAKSEE